MENRNAKIIISASGGTAGKGAVCHKIALPTAWMREMGIEEENRDVQLFFDGTTITISRCQTIDNFVQDAKGSKSKAYLIYFYDKEKLCTRIAANYTTQNIVVENYVSDPLKTAFGNNSSPSWAEYQMFLEERCIPKQRAGLREYLDAKDLPVYDPLAIVQKTNGRMAEDHQWLRIEEVVS